MAVNQGDAATGYLDDPTQALRRRVTAQIAGTSDPTTTPTASTTPSTPSPTFTSTPTGTAPGPSPTSTSLPSPGPGYVQSTGPSGNPVWTYAGYNPTTGQTTVDPSAPPAIATSGNPPSQVGSAPLSMPQGIDPNLWAIYQKAGVQPQGRGTGFADWQYWQDAGPSQYARLAADLAGTGSDQPTGTPGTGPWQSSGRGTTSSGGSSSGLLSTTGQSSDFENQVRALLMQRIAGDTGPIDESATGIKQAMDAAQATADRQTQQERTALAEQLYASGQGGLQTNAIPMAIQQSAEKNATALGTLRGQLILSAYQARMQDLQQAESQALSSGDAESAREIQAAMANLQAQLTREGYGVSLAEFTQQQNAGATIPALNP